MSTIVSPDTLEIDSRPVEIVRVVVHTSGPAGPTTSDNHWSISLVLVGSQGSIRINMRAEPGFIDGILEWTQQLYLLSTSAIRKWDFPRAKFFRVCDIANHIRDARRFRYDMSGGGSGCRYWV
ncbi:hypothetical protein AYO21_10859 [Fonsecaea monophora]|uniref:DUF7770 domain-containing protein n=1 Tax=Fonsecaea monophora TaxID=254056 RepID=A0A177EV99_9EURO|nr:hypothetical protein AYO21_10859 [Fonsecaea monophora]OAG34972.1 hypothetical protein AYO21_10859 [Fonsecaea monophora]